jgi:hypothetical protein
MAANPQGRHRFVAALGLAVAGFVVWLAWSAVNPPLAPRALLPPLDPWVVTPRSTVPPPAPLRPAADPRNAIAPARASDPVGSAPDLKRVFDDYIQSDDPRLRRQAVRAFEACVPAFLPGAGQSASAEALIRALPADHPTAREDAYRTLFARCHRLLAEDRTALNGARRDLERDPQNQAPGQRAQEAALAGELDRVETLTGDALNSADPAAVASLAGLAARIVAQRQRDAVDPAALQRAREVDVALSLTACDLGLDCSSQSLWALQMCATEGLCEGDATARLMARMTPGTLDAAAVQQQRLRLLSLLQSGRALGVDDLLPP